jgi:hypothetical protein
VAKLCVTTLGLTMPTYVDAIDDRASRAYRGWPERLFVIDRAGRVRYASAPGPAGFDPAVWERAILEVVAKPSVTR